MLDVTSRQMVEIRLFDELLPIYRVEKSCEKTKGQSGTQHEGNLVFIWSQQPNDSLHSSRRAFALGSTVKVQRHGVTYGVDFEMHGKAEDEAGKEVLSVDVKDEVEKTQDAHDRLGVASCGDVDGYRVVQRDHHAVLHSVFIDFHSLENDESEVRSDDVQEGEENFSEGGVNDIVRKEHIGEKRSVAVCVSIVRRLSLERPQTKLGFCATLPGQKTAFLSLLFQLAHFIAQNNGTVRHFITAKNCFSFLVNPRTFPSQVAA